MVRICIPNREATTQAPPASPFSFFSSAMKARRSRFKRGNHDDEEEEEDGGLDRLCRRAIISITASPVSITTIVQWKKSLENSKSRATCHPVSLNPFLSTIAFRIHEANSRFHCWRRYHARLMLITLSTISHFFVKTLWCDDTTKKPKFILP